jgi:hypothetical protein
MSAHWINGSKMAFDRKGAHALIGLGDQAFT